LKFRRSFYKGYLLITFATLAGMVGWLTLIVWQLRLARTKGKVLSRNGYVIRADNPTQFDACVIFYWIALVWGAGMLIGMLISAINQISN
jgi:hypothetical protein